MADMMIAGVASENGLAVREIARPTPGPEQVLVKVEAAGMNRADLNAAKGAGVASKESYGKAIGMEWAGTIVATGRDVSGFKPGDAVMCSGSGGYAEYAVADQGRTIALDDSGLTWELAAILPLVLMTAHDAVVTNGKTTAGDAVLVHGATSAVGIASIQIARLMGAKQIIGTSTSATRAEKLKGVGATHVVNSTDGDWADIVLALTEGKGANVIIDMVCGPSINQTMKAAAVLGRLVNVGRLGGIMAEFDFDLHSLKRISYIGTTFRSRSLAEVREVSRAMVADLWTAIKSRDISLPLDRSFSLGDAVKAHEYMKHNNHFGKIALVP